MSISTDYSIIPEHRATPEDYSIIDPPENIDMAGNPTESAPLTPEPSVDTPVHTPEPSIDPAGCLPDGTTTSSDSISVLTLSEGGSGSMTSEEPVVEEKEEEEGPVVVEQETIQEVESAPAETMKTMESNPEEEKESTPEADDKEEEREEAQDESALSSDVSQEDPTSLEDENPTSDDADLPPVDQPAEPEKPVGRRWIHVIETLALLLALGLLCTDSEKNLSNFELGICTLLLGYLVNFSLLDLEIVNCSQLRSSIISLYSFLVCPLCLAYILHATTCCSSETPNLTHTGDEDPIPAMIAASTSSPGLLAPLAAAVLCVESVILLEHLQLVFIAIGTVGALAAINVQKWYLA